MIEVAFKHGWGGGGQKKNKSNFYLSSAKVSATATNEEIRANSSRDRGREIWIFASKGVHFG